MFDKKINVLGKSSSSATKRILRQFRGVRRMNDIEYEEARIAYNREVVRRKTSVKNIQKSLENSLRNNMDTGFTFDLNQVHMNYPNTQEFLKYLIERLGVLYPDERIVLTMGDVIYTLSQNNRDKILQGIMNDIIRTEQFNTSDNELIQSIVMAPDIRIEKLPVYHTRNVVSGEFFPYLNKTKYDLSRYGIYQSIQQNYTVCFLEALQAGGLSDEKIELLKTLINDSKVPKCKIGLICDKLEIQVRLHGIGNRQVERYTYGKQYTEIYDLGIIEEHYFIYETTKNTRYSLEHYDEIKDHPRANEIYIKEGSKYKYKTERFINSMDLFRILLENKGSLIEKMSYDEITHTPYYNKLDNEIVSLNYDEKTAIEIKNDILDKIAKTKEKSRDIINVFADFETVTNGIHEPYLCSIAIYGVCLETFEGKDCGKNMLTYLKNRYKHIRLIFHNATYDYHFLVKYLDRFQQLCRGTHLLSAKGEYFGMKVEIKCSYNLITSPLKKFGAMFDLPQEKEVMPYEIYTHDNIQKRYLPVYETSQVFSKDKDRIRFVDNVEKWSLRRQDGTFDIVEYSRRYCEMDCIVLRDGYMKFREWIMDLEYVKDDNGGVAKCGLDIDYIITSASLAHQYMILSGCYEGVYELNGIPQRFIQQSVIGGRTMMANNKKDYINKPKNTGAKLYRKIADFDGVSLYPSAMKRMSGFLRGKPKVLQTTDYNIVKNYDGYFVEIDIHNIPIKRDFPLISRKNDDGIRVFSNDVRGKIVVDKIQLEDLITFHGLTENDFTIIRGYYFDEGFNNRINKAITFLFETRKQKKAENNPSQEIYKLIMNSAYGKTIMKEVITETIFHSCENETTTDRYNVYISRNFDWIQKIVSVHDTNKKIIHKIKSIDDHYNISQVGASVLSWSKRIMNEVMCLAEDIGVKIFYQDTDSLHTFEENIPTIAKAFREKYGREIIGKELGQFHTDFDIVYEDENGKERKCKEVHSRKLIMLGKKCYIDELVGIDHNGKQRISYHARMKGISNDALHYAVDSFKYDSLIELYEDLYNGETVEFDLCCGGKKAVFENHSNLTITTKTQYLRELKF